MYRAIFSMIVLVVTVVALAGCETASAPPGTPGSATAYVHGRTDVTIGGFAR